MVMKHKSDDDTNGKWCSLDDPQRLGKEAGRAGNRRMSRDHLNYLIFKICQNTEKSPGDPRRLVVTRTPVKYHERTLM